MNTWQKKKIPNPSEEQEAIEKENTPGHQGQKETFDSPLDLIPPARQAVEERIYLKTSE